VLPGVGGRSSSPGGRRGPPLRVSTLSLFGVCMVKYCYDEPDYLNQCDPSNRMACACRSPCGHSSHRCLREDCVLPTRQSRAGHDAGIGSRSVRNGAGKQAWRAGAASVCGRRSCRSTSLRQWEVRSGRTAFSDRRLYNRFRRGGLRRRSAYRETTKTHVFALRPCGPHRCVRCLYVWGRRPCRVDIHRWRKVPRAVWVDTWRCTVCCFGCGEGRYSHSSHISAPTTLLTCKQRQQSCTKGSDLHATASRCRVTNIRTLASQPLDKPQMLGNNKS